MATTQTNSDKTQNMQQTVQTFSWPVRVYYEDTDSGCVVYHANYLNFMERARTEWLRALGFEQTDLKAQLHVIFVVHSMALQFKSPARFNDEIIVQSQLIKVGQGSIEFTHTITRAAKVLIVANVKLACVDSETFKPTMIPAMAKKAMQNVSVKNR